MWRVVRFVVISVGMILAFLGAAFFDGAVETSLLAAGVSMIFLPLLARRLSRN